MNRLPVHKRAAIHIVACVLALPGIVRAATIHVDGAGTTGFHSIKEAIAAAASGDTVVLSAGTYSGDGNRGIIIADKTLTIRSTDPNDPAVITNTIVDCQGSLASQQCAFKIRASNGTRVTLAGLTIRNGRATVSGGAVQCEGARLRAVNCDFADNEAPWSGGAVYCVNGDAVFEGCTFVANTSDRAYGGAIACEDGRLEIVHCEFTDNSGSAIQSFDSDVMLDGCIFENNVGGNGGAIHSHADPSFGMPVDLHVNRCHFVGNVAATSGGAVYAYNGNAAFDACTFFANAAGEAGGGISVFRSNPTVTNCLFVGNTAAGNGGAVMNWCDNNAGIIQCTFVDNNAAAGGAVACQGNGKPLISHSILWHNTAPDGHNVYLGHYAYDTVHMGEATIEYSDIEGQQGSTRTERGCTIVWGRGNTDIDPLFAAPTDGDYHLSPDSPCIDAGDPNYRPNTSMTDLDADPRLVGSAVDMGAYEFQGLGPVYRFWSPTRSKHFYTISKSERDKLIYKYPEVWQLEDIAYYAFVRPVSEKLAPVYRFWSPVLRAHFWTISEEEKNRILKEMARTWTYEGVIFYAYPEGSQPLGTMPVHRFWSDPLRHHFYTLNENEKNKLIRDHGGTWTYEGIAFHTYAKPDWPKQGVYAFTGGSEGAWCAATLNAYVDGREAQIDAPNLEFVPTSTSMRMAIDFERLHAVVNEVHVTTQPLEHTATIRQSKAGGVVVPFVLSATLSFDASTQRGPFDIDPSTLIFADFTGAGEDRNGANEVYTWTGSVMFDRQLVEFNQTANALRFKLEAAGSFEALRLLPDGIDARMPFTFQWQRQYVKDLLAEATVNGHLIQLYAVYTYVSTQGLWQGQVMW